MGHRCCGKQKIKRGLWSPEEDDKLLKHITTQGHKSWSSVPKLAGLQRCGKSCRLRWINYLRPDLKRGSFTAEEEQIIIDIHRILGNRWAQIAKHLPGRTDNEVKNFWNSCIKKKLISQGLDPQTHNLLSSHKRNSASTISNNIIHQNSNSIFLLNSNIPNPNQIEITTQTFPSLPKASPNIFQTPSTIVSNNALEYQTSSVLSSDQLLTENISNICSTSCMNPYGNQMSTNEQSVWDSRISVEDFRGSSIDEAIQVQVQQEKEMDVREIDHDKRYNEMDASFDDSNFDFGLLESVLNSEFMSHDINNMDQLAWNF